MVVSTMSELINDFLHRGTTINAREKSECSRRTIMLIVMAIMGVAIQWNQSSAVVFLQELELRNVRQSGNEITMMLSEDFLRDVSGPASCALTASSSPQQKDIVIKKSEIRSFSKKRLNELIQFTFPKYGEHMMKPPGREHYTLLEYMTATYGDCRHVVDIGTRYVASSLALGSHETPVWTFDLPSSTEREQAFRGESEKQWKRKVEAAKVHIKFHNYDLLKVSNDDFRRYMSTWLIILDTHHRPYSAPFEREWLDRLLSLGDFSGLVLLDDINLNNEMKQWWKELQAKATERGYKPFELTSVGHVSGTGLLDFSGKVKIVE
jgi:hypothetical protein